jgi:hypothetical protein
MLKLKYISWVEEYIFLVVFVAHKHKNKQHKHKPLKMQCNGFQFQAHSSLCSCHTISVTFAVVLCCSPFVDGLLEAPVYLL